MIGQQATGAFPDLNDYFSCWPVHDLIQMRLKYTYIGESSVVPTNGGGEYEGKEKNLIVYGLTMTQHQLARVVYDAPNATVNCTQISVRNTFVCEIYTVMSEVR